MRGAGTETAFDEATDFLEAPPDRPYRAWGTVTEEGNEHAFRVAVDPLKRSIDARLPAEGGLHHHMVRGAGVATWDDDSATWIRHRDHDPEGPFESEAFMVFLLLWLDASPPGDMFRIACEGSTVTFTSVGALGSWVLAAQSSPPFRALSLEARNVTAHSAIKAEFDYLPSDQDMPADGLTRAASITFAVEGEAGSGDERADRLIVDEGSEWVPASDLFVVVSRPGGAAALEVPLRDGASSSNGDARVEFKDSDDNNLLSPGDEVGVSAPLDATFHVRDTWANAPIDASWSDETPRRYDSRAGP